MALPDKRKTPAGNGGLPEDQAGGRSTPIVPDEIHTAWLAGWDAGYVQGRRASAEDMARALLHEQACAMAGLARHTASAKGPAWAQAIAEQAVGE